MSDAEEKTKSLISGRSNLLLIAVVLVVSVVVLGAVLMGAFQEEASTQNDDVVEWTHTIDTTYPSTLSTAENGTVYFMGATENDSVQDPEEGAKNLSVYAVEADTGEEIWKFGLGDGIIPHIPFTVSDGTVYVGDFNGNIYGLDAQTGDEIWERDLKDGLALIPLTSIANGTVYGVDRSQDRIYAFDSGTGKEEWNYTLSRDSTTFSAAATNNTVYVGVAHSRGTPSIFAINSSTAETKWNYAAESTDIPVFHQPVIARNTVYARSQAGNVYALDADTGEEEWRSNATNNPETATDASPAVTDGHVYVRKNNFYALDADTGNEDWEFETEYENELDTNPIVVNGTVYVGHGGYTVEEVPLVYALDAETGELNWKVISGEKTPEGRSADFSDGLLYVGATGGKVYALNVTALEEGGKTSYDIGG